jgi:hypothetical protein
MPKNQIGTVRNGKIHPSRVRLPGSPIDSAPSAKATFVRSSHSLSSRLAKRVRKLAYEQKTSESSIIECALWLFFEKGFDVNVLGLMSRADIAPRRRRS